MIRYLSRRQVNDAQWNRVIAASAFEAIYPYTWYLDACADNWAALVMNDYECIMPVAFRRKIGLRYTYQPLYCQQLGVFSSKPVDPEVVRMFLHALGRHFQMGDYAFNEGNVIGDEPGFDVTDNTNYLLPLGSDYPGILANYNENCRRNVRKAGEAGITYTGDITVEDVVALKKFSDTTRRSPQHYEHITRFFNRLKAMDRLQLCGARVGDHLVAAAIFAFSNKRAYYLLSASSESGKELRAMFLVVDRFVRQHAGTDRRLDFEGSNITSVARFFRGFGAKPQIYQRAGFSNTISKLRKFISRV